MTWKIFRIPSHSEKVLEISGTLLRQVGKEDPVLLDLLPVEDDGEEDRDDNGDSREDIGCKGPSSEDVI